MTPAPPSLHQARVLWEYLGSFIRVEPADAIVVCCSYDLRVCDYACELFHQGLAPKILFSGDTGNWTRLLWDAPEAEIFATRALEKGVPLERILKEPKARHLGDNVLFAKNMLLDAQRVLFVTKPNTLLRVALTTPVQWPEVTPFFGAPPHGFPDGVSPIIGLLGVIHEMVGDLERIQTYPALGYQAPHKLPREVLEAWSGLKERGFTQHLARS